jgi:CRP/FNR family transcriptional regulator, cyclic AMP receptor protein
MAMLTASLPLGRPPAVPACVRALARAAPAWAGRGRIPATTFDPQSAVLLVEDGALIVSAVRPSGRVVALALLGAGDVWTVATSAAPEPGVRADALCPSSVALIERDALAEGVATDADAANWLAVAHLRRAAAAERRVADALTLPVDQRVRSALADLARTRGTPLADGRVRLGLRISQERLAWLAATTRESANRAVAALIAAGDVSRIAGRYVLSPGVSGEGPS